ncbi:S8 family serine peptidase [Spirulina subsalsa FACHB-351]|uniref:S8 family serine peptidase n=1 Tax=Spirulina subsalsa FACHB-351 TaxID=234711 RepID=A0ABT3L2J3_9CYAN|nr:S8 family serine peptidase [Spirulina subsalsa]MCW6035728.1 S8 family serine peptidase [Spirulina subsalsa FACHB-351]
MTNPEDMELSPRGVVEAKIGLILQRGGEELPLLKVGDRFTLALKTQEIPAAFQQWRLRAIPPSELWEVQVTPQALEEQIALARQHPEVAFASHVYQLQQSPETLLYLSRELTLQFRDSLTETEQQAIADSWGLDRQEAISGIPNTFIYFLTPTSPENPLKLANRLSAHPDILTAEPNVILQQAAYYRPQEEHYSEQWYLFHQGGNQLAVNSHIDIERAWDITRGVRSVVVAVADDAIDLNHPDFQGKGKIVAPYDFKDQDFLPLPGNRQESHGTACAGIAVAEENGKGIIGVAPNCALMPLRTTGYLDDRSIEQLFNWAVENKADVISCSWGAAVVHFPLSLRQRAALHRAATQGREGKGCVIVFAAGNANRPVQGKIYERDWPNNLLNGPTDWLSGFAAHPDVIAVAASTSLNKKAAYSNWGEHISVCAPSNNAPPGMWFQKTGFVQTAPRVTTWLPGRGIFTTDLLGDLGYDAGDFTRSFGGTSSACPVVAGVAALMLSVNPNLTAQQVKQLLQNSADKIVDRDRDPQLGLQLGTYNQQGHSQWFGYGKVNAFRAVQAAQQQQAQGGRTDKVQTVELRQNQPLTIPDHEPRGVVSAIALNQGGPVEQVEVQLELRHQFLGDLEVYLLPPSGETLLLQNRSLGNQTMLRATYNSLNTPLLQRLKGQSGRGNWQLWIIDHALGDTGQLWSWGLKISLRL